MIKGYLTKEEYLKARRHYSNLKAALDEIAASDQMIAEIAWEGMYANVRAAASSYYVAIKRYGYAFKVAVSNNRLFIVKIE